MTIKKEHMFEPLLEACPSFLPIYKEFLSEWQEDEDTKLEGLPYYLALGDLAHHLIELLKVRNTKSFSKVFEVVETWHVEGTNYVKEAATIGLLEGIQNIASHDKSINSEDFLFWLGPISKESWHKLNQFWNRVLEESNRN